MLPDSNLSCNDMKRFVCLIYKKKIPKKGNLAKPCKERRIASFRPAAQSILFNPTGYYISDHKKF